VHHANPAFDAEIDARSFGVFGIWLTIAVLIITALMYWMYRDLQKSEIRLDAPASPLVDRSQPHLPPEPRLQVTPERDLVGYRAAQTQARDTYGWVDESRGIVHVPVSRAMDLVVEKGIGAAASQPVPVMPVPVPSTPVPVPPPARGGH